MFDVLGLGYVAVDDIIYVDAFPPPDAKTPVLRAERHCGGLTATALVAAARLGSKCAYAGTLGTDELSTFAMTRLRQEKINLEYCLQSASAGPVHSFIVVDEDRQTRNIFFDTSRAVGPAENWPKADVIQSARVLFVDTCGLDSTVRAARVAREAGVPVVADFERHHGEKFVELLGLVDHLILSQAFAQKLTGCEEPGMAANRLWNNKRRVVVVTCGANGCWYVADDDQAKHHPAFKVQATDTTGCGDVFHGAYASVLARGLGLTERICFASAAAALKATQPGGQLGIPSRQVVESFLDQQSL